ncbi:MAG TPA: ATPase domain-containing protein, partial [Burkholderiales bacterium]|nr:ATPase domain-containing protein [Burkholderiales bacterium]
MAKSKSIYICTECGGHSTKWQGQCPHCSAWNTMVESVAEAAPTSHRYSGLAKNSALTSLAKIGSVESPRMPTGIPEFDRVLGGGLVAGQVVLIGGDPGIGKSTLLLQALAEMGAKRKVIYVSGE